MPFSLNDIFFLPPVYMAPTIAAFFYKGRQSSLLEIFLVNLLFGWTYIGWLFAASLIFFDSRGLSTSSTRSSPTAPSANLGTQVASSDASCGACGGSALNRCQACNGSGGATQRHEHGEFWVHCTPCGGKGKVTCWSCGGTGRTRG
jgi:hypothetical protein